MTALAPACAEAAWLGYKNDTPAAIVVQSASMVGSQVRLYVGGSPVGSLLGVNSNGNFSGKSSHERSWSIQMNRMFGRLSRF